MLLFHASNTSVLKPDISYSRDYLDFGRGFYLTSLREQAEKYALRFRRRQQEAWLNIYDLSFDPQVWKIHQFSEYDKDWLNFISMCRAGEDKSSYELIIGGIANDKVIQTLDRYFEGEISEAEAIGLLKYEKPNNQYCIRSQQMIDKCLKHIESIQI